MSSRQPDPDFQRLRTALLGGQPDRVPLAEVAVDYAIMSQFLGRPVTDEDVAGQVEFWTRAGYDYALFTLGLRDLPASQASVIATWEVVTAALLGWLLFGEHLTAVQIVGAALVCTGIAWIQHAEA